MAGPGGPGAPGAPGGPGPWCVAAAAVWSACPELRGRDGGMDNPSMANSVNNGWLIVCYHTLLASIWHIKHYKTILNHINVGIAINHPPNHHKWVVNTIKKLVVYYCYTHIKTMIIPPSLKNPFHILCFFRWFEYVLAHDHLYKTR